jgi:hypothetical protein
MRKVTLRFYVAQITEHAGGNWTVVMQPSYKDGANKDWAKFTPSGRIELGLSQEAAIEFYQEALRNKSTIGIEMFVTDDA